MRKKLAIFFLALAQIVILGHSVILHHHDAEESGTHSHSHDQDHTCKNSWDIAFSSFIHSGDQAVFTDSDNTEVSFFKTIPQPSAVVVQNPAVIFQAEEAQQKNVLPIERRELYQSLHLLSYSLRGPPIFIA